MSAPASVTNNLNFSLKPVSVKCHHKTLTIPSSNKLTFSPLDTAVLYLPSLKGHVMDGQSGYLKFNVTVTGTGYVDVSAHSFIERITSYGAGGQVISDINCYRSIATAMIDLQLSESDKLGQSSMLGVEPEYLTLSGWSAGNALFADATKPTQAELEAVFKKNIRRGKAVANGSTYTFCIPLLHPFFSLSEKYLPVYSLGDSSRIEIQWSAIGYALVSSTAYTISNPEIIVDYIQLDDAVMPLIEQTYAGRDLVIPPQDYKYYSSLISSGSSGTLSQIIPAKQQSARALFFRFKPAETNVATAGAEYATGSSICPLYSAGDSFVLNIGGERVPQKPITTDIAYNFSNYFAYTMTSLHAFNSTEMNSCLPQNYYETYSTQAGHYVSTSSPYAGSFRNAFVLGINLDQLRGQNQTTNSGRDLSQVTTYYEMNIATAPKNTTGNDEAVAVDCFVLHDALFIISQDGSCSVRW